MGVVINQSIKGTIFNYIGVGIGAINLIFLFPKFLQPDEIGLTRVLIDVALVFASLAQLGSTNIADRFFPHFKNEQLKHNGFLLFLLLYPLMGFIIICSLFLLIKDFWLGFYQNKSPLLNNYFFHVIPLAFFIMYQSIFEAYSKVHYKIVVPIFVKEIFLRVFLAIGVMVYFFDLITLNQLVLVLIVSYASAVVLLIFYIGVLKKLYFNFISFKKHKNTLKEIFSFGLFIFLSSALGLVASKIDVVMLSGYAGLKTAGIYSIAFFIGTIIEIPRRAISQITVPFISQAWRNKDLSTINDIYKKTSLNQLIVGALLFLLIWFNVDSIISLMPNSDIYKTGKYVIFVIGLCKLVDMATGVNTEIILNSPYYKFNFLLTIFSGLLVIGSNYLLIPKYGMMGAAISTLISFVLFNFIKFVFLKLKVKIQPFSKSTALVLILGIITGLIAHFLPENNTYFIYSLLSISYKSLLIIGVFVGTIVKLGISEEFNKIVFGGLKILKIPIKE